MPALNYKHEFALKVENRTKRQTIRKQRKNPIKVGDRLYHYEGMRTKKCRKLGEDNCTEVLPIFIGRSGTNLDGRGLLREEEYELACQDGFELTRDFLGFFGKTYGLPFVGVVIRW